MPRIKSSVEVKVMASVLVTLLVTLLMCTIFLTFQNDPMEMVDTSSSHVTPVNDAILQAQVRPAKKVRLKPAHNLKIESSEPVQYPGNHVISDAITQTFPEYLIREATASIPPSILPEQSSILTTSILPANTDFHPEVGNGHIATVIRGDTIYMNGLYNGYNISSHRAMIDSSVGYRITATVPTGLKRKFSLDLGRGFFTESFNGPGVNISLRTYAHRILTRVMVVELEMSREDPSLLVTATLALNSGCKSDDVNLISKNGSLFHYRTREPEYEELAPRTDFYVKSSRTLEGVVSMKSGVKSQSFLVLSAIGVNKYRVLSEFDQAISMFQNGSLLSSHVAEWTRKWKQGRIDVTGDVATARNIYASLYYLFSSIPFHPNEKEWPFIGLSPGGLAHGKKDMDYLGHVFWDQDTWMFPGLAFLHSDFAKLMVETRTRTLKAAQMNAKQTEYEGARYPWESAFTGLETCPAWPYSDYEIHINGDVAMMFRQYWQLTGDLELMTQQKGAEVIQEVAKFWASRVTYRPDDDSYRIYEVMPPDEYYWPVNDSVYTNNIAVLSLNFANQISTTILGKPPNRTWAKIADKMHLPYDPDVDYHPEFARYRLHESTKQADVVLLNFPLMVDMNDSTRENDLRLYEDTIPDGTVPAMTWGMYLIGWLQLGNETKAEELLKKSTKNAQQPFLVWTENADGHGAVNFITGMGGYLQSIIFGYGGCRIYDNRLTFDPRLIPGTNKVKFVDIDYRGFSFDLEYDQEHMNLTLILTPNKPNEMLEVKLQQSRLWKPLLLGRPIKTQRQKFQLRLRKASTLLTRHRKFPR